MTPFTILTSRVIALDRGHVDTDQIIPKQFLKTTTRAGLGRGLFYNWRADPAFVFNQPQAREAAILVTGENFGCGSSREHAPWALLDFGIRAILAPSFGDIFHNNCCKNGLLPVRLAAEDARRLLGAERLTIDLAAQRVSGCGEPIAFAIEAFRKQCLLEGLDDIALTLRHEAAINSYEEAHA